MKRFSIALAVLIGCLCSQTAVCGEAGPFRYLLAQPNASAPAPIDDDGESIIPALRWRLLTMEDEHGQIPPNARYAANARRRNNIHGHSVHGGVLPLGSISPTTWVSRGPQNVGGRTRSLLIDPFNTNLLFAGSVSGGIWKSTNGGTTWTPLDDFMANLNIQTMVMDPLDHQTIYAGTGETTDYGDSLPGSGIFKSTDGGNTWNQLTNTQNWQRVYRLAMQPNVSGILLAAKDDGIWRSADGGSTWSHVYTPPIGIVNVVAFDPNNGNNAISCGATNGGGYYYLQFLYSSDGGVHWNNSSMPTQVTNFSAVEGAWGPSSNVYVNIGVPDGLGHYGEVWRSTNGGVSYTRVSAQGVTDCTYNHCAIWVSPINANIVVVGGVYNQRSSNGGASFGAINYAINLSDEPHADTHWFVNDPVNPNKVYVCNDGGVYRTNDITTAQPGNGSWVGLNATYQTSQYYAGAGINDGAAWPLVGGTQDNGTLRVSVYDQLIPSYRAAATANQWSIGGDGGYAAIDPLSTAYMYGEYQWMEVFRSTNGGETGSASDITNGLPWGSGGRAGFISPLVMDPNDHNTLLAGGSSLWRTTTASYPTPTWSAIRGDSTPLDYISAIAVAKGNSNIIWVGQNDGRLQKTTNGLQSNPTWVDIDNNNPGTDPLPNRSILRIMIDPADANIVYVTLGGYSINSPQPANLWRTVNGGTTWSPVVGSGTTALPMVPIWSIVRHPRNQQQLYVATDIGIYESSDYGATWSTSQQGPADVSVEELAFVTGSELLLAATHGRGMWTADVSSVPSFAPSGVNAQAAGTTVVNVSWTGMSAATAYQVMRSNNGNPYANLGGQLTGTAYADTSVAASTTYLYRVKALVGGTWTDLSAPDLAATIVYTDDDTLSGKTIQAIHLQELHTAVNAVMAAAGQTGTFGAITAGTTVLSTDISDLRSALASAYAAIGMPAPPAFAEAITPQVTPIRATHFQEIRDATK